MSYHLIMIMPADMPLNSKEIVFPSIEIVLRKNAARNNKLDNECILHPGYMICIKYCKYLYIDIRNHYMLCLCQAKRDENPDKEPTTGRTLIAEKPRKSSLSLNLL